MSVPLQRHLGNYIGQLVYHRTDSLNQLRGTGMADSQWHWMEKNKNLEKKGYVQGVLFGNVYVYKPLISREEYKKKFMSSVVREYFSDSYKDLVNFFVKDKKLSAQELKEILKLIEAGTKK